MRIIIAQSAWDEMAAELDRVAPAEGVLLPLVALRSTALPAAPRTLATIEALVIAGMLRVPAALQTNAAIAVRVLPSADATMQREVERVTAQHPRLRVAAYLHSHPFAFGRTWPSAGDYDGHMLPLAAQNERAGVATSFSLIACRERDGWALQTFALDGGRRVVDLGFAQKTPDGDPLVRWALQPPLSRPARAILRQLCRRHQRAGREVRSTELFDGVRRYVVREGGAPREVLFVPCDFPAAPARRFAIDANGLAKEEAS
ncbi:MAG: hypothetical protein IT381_02570 [Deltaproteobacteria bacterium]|nr:hypothetical protein [Deltaproteobacteria bacterium]